MAEYIDVICKYCNNPVTIEKEDKLAICMGGHTHITLSEITERKRKRESNKK